ncbi:integral membrane protein, partial [Metarhizium majus ARSEF 297]
MHILNPDSRLGAQPSPICLSAIPRIKHDFHSHPQSANRLNTQRSMRALCLWIQQSCHQLIHDDNAPPTPASPSRPPPFASNSTTRTSKMQPTVVLGLNILMCICAASKAQQHLVQLGNRSDQTRTTYDLFAWVADGPFTMVVCAIPTLHLVARWLRSAAGSIKSKVKPNTSSKSAPRAPSDAAATELGDMAFTTASTKTTIERGALARSESAGNLEEEALPENGVRVDMVYNVRRDTRTNSECSKRRRWSGWGYEGRRFGNDKPVA